MSEGILKGTSITNKLKKLVQDDQDLENSNTNDNIVIMIMMIATSFEWLLYREQGLS